MECARSGAAFERDQVIPGAIEPIAPSAAVFITPILNLTTSNSQRYLLENLC